MGHKDDFIRAAIAFAFRRRHPARYLVGSGVALFSLLLAGMAFDFEMPLPNGPLRLAFSLEGETGIATYSALALAVILMISGLSWLYSDWRKADRRRVFAIEFRGLRDWQGTPLVQAIPPIIEGQRVELLLDLRQKIADGVIVAAEAAIERILPLRTMLDHHEQGRNREDIVHVTGGLAPVPLSFLGGILLDDESPIIFLDWNRETLFWNELNAEDDGERFTIVGIESIGEQTPEVIVTVSASYRVDEPAAVARVSGVPVVRLSLPTVNTRNHWSGDKQQALGRQFLDTMVDLKGRGVHRVHLFLAGANSLVLRFGTVYDKRNLPALIVYQYESNAFTWGVEMPVAGVARPRVVGAAEN